MLPMLDLESLEGMSLAEVTQWTGRWVHTVTRELRRRGLVAKPIIYTPFNLGNGFGCLLWVARYSDDFRAPMIPKPWRRAAIWQHSNGRYGPVKHVPGFGPVDVNAVHPDVPLSALRDEAGPPTGGHTGPGPRLHGHISAGARAVAEAVAPGAGGRACPSTSRSFPSSCLCRSFRTPVAVPALPDARGGAGVPRPLPRAGAPRAGGPAAMPTCRPCRRCPPVPQPALAAAPDVQLMINLAVARVQLETAAQQLAAALDRLPER